MDEVILIGDRSVGKTQLVKSLLLPPKGKITIPNVDPKEIHQGSTRELFDKTLEIQASLKAPKRLSMQWIDTPGEWNDQNWQRDIEKEPDLKKYQARLGSAVALVLLLRPYRTAGKKKIVDKTIVETHDVCTAIQWCRRFERWVSFISTNCPQVRYINVCLGKADLFCDVKEQDSLLDSKGWLDRSYYVCKEFFPKNPTFSQSIVTLQGKSVNFFITSIQNRFLLELPWLYLATHL